MASPGQHPCASLFLSSSAMPGVHAPFVNVTPSSSPFFHLPREQQCLASRSAAAGRQQMFGTPCQMFAEHTHSLTLGVDRLCGSSALDSCFVGNRGTDKNHSMNEVKLFALAQHICNTFLEPIFTLQISRTIPSSYTWESRFTTPLLRQSSLHSAMCIYSSLLSARHTMSGFFSRVSNVVRYIRTLRLSCTDPELSPPPAAPMPPRPRPLPSDTETRPLPGLARP